MASLAELKSRAQSGLVLDGGLATELESRGANLLDPLWSARLLIENPSLIQEVHCHYLQAGADIITSASYQTSFDALKHKGYDRLSSANIIKSSVDLAKQVRDRFCEEQKQTFQKDNQRPLVAGSMGSYGATLGNGEEFTGDFSLSANELTSWHRPRFEVLSQSGADLLAFETIPSAREAEAIARLLEDSGSLPAWISFSCKNSSLTGSGDPLLSCMKIFKGISNVVALGINCTSPHLISDLLISIQDQISIPLIVYPNSGELWNHTSRCWVPQSGQKSFSQKPLNWQTHAKEWWKFGARIIGGCCRTTPTIIQTIAQEMKQLTH